MDTTGKLCVVAILIALAWHTAERIYRRNRKSGRGRGANLFALPPVAPQAGGEPCA
jgi:hypothetical protein